MTLIQDITSNTTEHRPIPATQPAVGSSSICDGAAQGPFRARHGHAVSLSLASDLAYQVQDLPDQAPGRTAKPQSGGN